MKTYLMNVNTGSIFNHDEVAELADMVEVIDVGGVWVDNTLNDDLLKLAIDGAENNNEINNANWADWDCTQDLLNVYTDGKGCEWIHHILDRAIESDGATLAEDLPRVERIVWGQNFSGSFWDRC